MNFIKISLLTLFLIIKVNSEIKRTDNKYSVCLFENDIPDELISDLKKNLITDEGLYAITKLAIERWSPTIDAYEYMFRVNYDHYDQLQNFVHSHPPEYFLSDDYFTAIVDAKNYPPHKIANHVLMSLIELKVPNIQFCYLTRTLVNGEKIRVILILKEDICDQL